MKAILACALLGAVLLSLEAAPYQPDMNSKLRTITLTEKGSGNLHDIWSVCSGSSDPAKVLNITIIPDPPQKGVTLKLVATIDLSEQVTSGQIEISLKWGFLPIDQKVDLCTALKEDGKSCPLQPGTQTLSVSQAIPSEAPSGHYTGHAYVRDQNGKELVCIALDFHM